MLANEGLRPQMQHRRTAAVEHRANFAKRQQQEIDQRVGDAVCGVWQQLRSFPECGMDKVMGDPAGAGARRKFESRHLRRLEAAFVQQFRRHDDDFVPRQRWADDGMRTGYIIGQTIAGLELDAAATLFEMRNAVGLKQDLDVGMLARLDPRNRQGDPMLASLDLTDLQPCDSGVVDLRLERAAVQRVNVKLAAQFGQCSCPILNLLPG